MLNQDEFIKVIANLLRELRRNNQLTLEKLAEKSDIDYTTTSLIENGKQHPRLYTFYKILYALDIDIVKLIDNKSASLDDSKNRLIQRIDKLDEEKVDALISLIDNFNIEKK